MPLTIFQDADGELFYKDCKISKITARWMYGTRLGTGANVVIGISSKPIIQPMPSQAEPAKPFDENEFQLWKRKNDALLAWWRRK